jgi:DNA-directed RNA polymerase subunit omega
MGYETERRFRSNYRYILVAARRARQLSSGAPPLVDTSARKPCKIAQQEIDAGKIQFITGSKVEEPAVAAEPKVDEVK